MNKGNNSLAAGVLIVGLVVGLAIGYPLGHHNGAKKTSTTTMNMTASTSTDGVTVGGAKMVDTQNIVQNALRADNVTTTVKLVEDANLVSTLESDGPFTVFAPNNAAFAKLPKATVTSLQQPANVAALKNILTYHVVSGTYTEAALKVMAEHGEGLTTVQGEQIMPVMQNGQVALKDMKGDIVTIQTPDIISTNGVTFVINSVLMP